MPESSPFEDREGEEIRNLGATLSDELTPWFSSGEPTIFDELKAKDKPYNWQNEPNMPAFNRITGKLALSFSLSIGYLPYLIKEVSSRRTKTRKQH